MLATKGVLLVPLQPGLAQLHWAWAPRAHILADLEGLGQLVLRQLLCWWPSALAAVAVAGISGSDLGLGQAQLALAPVATWAPALCCLALAWLRGAAWAKWHGKAIRMVDAKGR
jgi:hypothetical protein